MSWDVFIQDLPKDVKHIREIPDDFEGVPLGPRSEIIRRILELAPEADFSDPSWGHVEADRFSIEVNLGDAEEVGGFALHVRGGESAIPWIAELLLRNGWRAVDPQSETGLFEGLASREGFEKWHAFRDRVIGGRSETTE